MYRCTLGAVAVALLASACSPAGPRAQRGEPTVAAPGARAPIDVGADVDAAGPQVAVGLKAGAAEVTIASGGPMLLGEPSGSGSDRRATGPCVATAEGGAVSVRCADGLRLRSRGEAVRLRPGSGGVLRVDDRPYDGDLLVRVGADGLTVVNTLALETYLLGVVPHEIGARPVEEIEAVKAQAVAARTYAIAHRGRRRSLGFDYWANSNDQVYRGLEGQDPVAARAVRETRGEIVEYEGEAILAFYHSTCGGRTAAIDQVWRRGPLPYLRSVSDLREDGTAWCESSNRFRWSQRWNWSELGEILEETVGWAPGTVLREMRIRGRTRSGRVAELQIAGDAGTTSVYGDSVRWALRPEAGRILNSSLIFDVETGAGESGERYLEVHGGGWGHGIGMCQVGAMARARFGQGYERILGTYYPGTDIKRIY
ncbi:MAG: SpoIID/LytB domain-containing protein [Gemmatimonadota bacterium]